jgi:hypothetical protein
MASYVLNVDIWYRQGEVEQTRHVRGDTLEDLTDAEVIHLKRAGAIVEAKSDEGKRAVERAEATAPAVDVTATPQPTGYQQSEYGTALGNSALGPEDAGPAELSDEQWEEETAVSSTQAEAIAAARAAGGSGATVGAGERSAGERPAKSATVDEWRRWATQSGKANADSAEAMSKSELQALK